MVSGETVLKKKSTTENGWQVIAIASMTFGQVTVANKNKTNPEQTKNYASLLISLIFNAMWLVSVDCRKISWLCISLTQTFFFRQNPLILLYKPPSKYLCNVTTVDEKNDPVSKLLRFRQCITCNPLHENTLNKIYRNSGISFTFLTLRSIYILGQYFVTL